MPEIVTDLIVTPVTVYHSTYGTTLPADSLAVGGTWPVGWTKLGFTSEPLKLGYAYDIIKLMVEQSLGTVAARKTSEEVTLATVIAEFAGASLERAWNAALTSTPAAPGQVGKEELTLGDDAVLAQKQWGFEGSYRDEDDALFPIRCFVWKGVPSEGGEIEFGKAVLVGTPIKILALHDMTKSAGQRAIKIQRVLEPAT